MAVFRAAAEERFAERLRAYIAEEYPERYRALGEDGTRKLVRKGFEAAARYGIDTEGATAVLVELMIVFGERLERSPERAWAETILTLPDIPGQVKVSAVSQRFAEATGGRRLVMVST